MYVCVHIHERPTLYVGPCLPLCLRQGLFVPCSISGLACELPGTLLSTSLTDACVGLALHGFSGFKSIACAFIHRAISSVPKAVLPSHSCFAIKMSGTACSKFLPISVHFLSHIHRRLFHTCPAQHCFLDSNYGRNPPLKANMPRWVLWKWA